MTRSPLIVVLRRLSGSGPFWAESLMTRSVLAASCPQQTTLSVEVSEGENVADQKEKTFAEENFVDSVAPRKIT